jgi:hypothetical protein
VLSVEIQPSLAPAIRTGTKPRNPHPGLAPLIQVQQEGVAVGYYKGFGSVTFMVPQRSTNTTLTQGNCPNGGWWSWVLNPNSCMGGASSCGSGTNVIVQVQRLLRSLRRANPQVRNLSLVQPIEVKNWLKRYVAFALLAVSCLVAWSSGVLAANTTSARSSKLASYDWSVKASPNLARNPPRKEMVNSFLRSLMDPYEELDEVVCSLRFADLRHDGNLSLVAGTDSSGRMLCSEVYIVDKAASSFDVFLGGFSVGAGTDVSSSIEDVGRDGNFEYVADWNLGSITGQCIASWPVVYGWTGDGYKNVSDRFKDFYKRTLDALSSKISALPPEGSPEQRSFKECLMAEAAQIQRFLGTAPDAGLNEVVRLANSKDSGEREFAADLLGSIGPPVARKYLEALSKDNDRSVSDSAKYYLSGLSKGPIHPPDELRRAR